MVGSLAVFISPKRPAANDTEGRAALRGGGPPGAPGADSAYEVSMLICQSTPPR